MGEDKVLGYCRDAVVASNVYMIRIAPVPKSRSTTTIVIEGPLGHHSDVISMALPMSSNLARMYTHTHTVSLCHLCFCCIDFFV